MKAKLQIILLMLTAAAQSVVLYLMVSQNNSVLTDGDVYRFRIDYNYQQHNISGRYVKLHFAAEKVELHSEMLIEPRSTVWVKLAVDSLGFAIADSLLHNEPEEDTPYLKARYLGYYHDEDGVYATVEYPFEMYYINEEAAAMIDSLNREPVIPVDTVSNQKPFITDGYDVPPSYAVVRVKLGQGAVEDLVIYGVSTRLRKKTAGMQSRIP